MEMEKTEGKVLGYNKKILAMIVALVIVAGGAFYIGSKYEKNKLSKLGLLKEATGATVKTKKSKQQPATDITSQMDNLTDDTNNTDGNSPVTPTNVQ
jgi:hypothetical protein